MPSILLLGGTRSGKSILAQRLASGAAQRLGAVVSVCASGVATDTEMASRIAAHQADRPAHWQTVEAAYDLDAGVASVPRDHVVVVDCVTVWLSNLIVRGDSIEAIERRGAAFASQLASRGAPTVVVSNEVGMGVVPEHRMGRDFRDVQGRVNRELAAVLERSYLVVAGRLLSLHDADDIGALWG